MAALIRVLGHEINNSLAPIKSIAGSLESMLARDALPDDWSDDMKRGLAIIAARSDSLSRFTTAYARLASLPAPRLDRSTCRRWCGALPASRRACRFTSPTARTCRSAPIPISSNSC